MTNPTPSGDVPIVVPGATDYALGTQLGDTRRFELSKLPASSATVAAQVAAEAAQVAAEAARDAAQLSAGVYATTAAGIAATVDGEYFSVPSADTDEYLILYKNVAEVATEVKTYPSSVPVQRLEGYFATNTHPDFAWLLIDADGMAAMGIDNEGRAHVAEHMLPTLFSSGDSLTTGDDIPSGYAYAIRDANGMIAFGIKDDGTVAVGNLETGELSGRATTDLFAAVDEFNAVEAAAGSFDAEVNMIPTYGQSLSLGVAATDAITTSQRFDSLMFNGGVRPADTSTDPAVSKASFTALVEVNHTGTPEFPGVALGETPAGGMCEAIKELIASENGIAYGSQNYQLLSAADGEGSKSVAQLSSPSGYYTRLTASIQEGYDLAQADGKSYAVPAFTFTQGEQDYVIDTAQAAYATAVESLRASVEATAQGITGQSAGVVAIVSQTASHKSAGRATPKVALGQLQAAVDSADVVLACPMYHLTFGTDDTHLSGGTESKKLGAHYGVAYKRTIVDGEKFQPMRPLSMTRQGSIALVKMHVPVAPMVIDTTLVAENTDYGFELVDSADTPIAISSVSIVNGEYIKVVAASPIPAGAKLRYAWTGAGDAGPIDGPRGNIRDSQGDDLIFDPDGINYAVHNWCVIFEETFA